MLRPAVTATDTAATGSTGPVVPTGAALAAAGASAAVSADVIADVARCLPHLALTAADIRCIYAFAWAEKHSTGQLPLSIGARARPGSAGSASASFPPLARLASRPQSTASAATIGVLPPGLSAAVAAAVRVRVPTVALRVDATFDNIAIVVVAPQTLIPAHWRLQQHGVPKSARAPRARAGTAAGKGKRSESVTVAASRLSSAATHPADEAMSSSLHTGLRRLPAAETAGRARAATGVSTDSDFASRARTGSLPTDDHAQTVSASDSIPDVRDSSDHDDSAGRHSVLGYRGGFGDHASDGGSDTAGSVRSRSSRTDSFSLNDDAPADSGFDSASDSDGDASFGATAAAAGLDPALLTRGRAAADAVLPPQVPLLRLVIGGAVRFDRYCSAAIIAAAGEAPTGGAATGGSGLAGSPAPIAIATMPASAGGSPGTSAAGSASSATNANATANSSIVSMPTPPPWSLQLTLTALRGIEYVSADPLVQTDGSTTDNANMEQVSSVVGRGFLWRRGPAVFARAHTQLVPVEAVTGAHFDHREQARLDAEHSTARKRRGGLSSGVSSGGTLALPTSMSTAARRSLSWLDDEDEDVAVAPGSSGPVTPPRRTASPVVTTGLPQRSLSPLQVGRDRSGSAV